MAEHLTVEACKALRELGYPQGGWPQFVWTGNYRFSSNLAIIECWHDKEWGVTYVACPDPLVALTWLEEECGWRWYRSRQNFAGTWMARAEGYYDDPVFADDPSALILAIAAHHDSRPQPAE